MRELSRNLDIIFGLNSTKQKTGLGNGFRAFVMGVARLLSVSKIALRPRFYYRREQLDFHQTIDQHKAKSLQARVDRLM
jgi:hypothetical protein